MTMQHNSQNNPAGIPLPLGEGLGEGFSKHRANPSSAKTKAYLRQAKFLLLAAGIIFTAPFAHAQGCAPAPAGGGGALPPCCASADMSGGGDCMAPATQYRVTILSFGFEKDDGTIVEFGAPRSFDFEALIRGGKNAKVHH